MDGSGNNFDLYLLPIFHVNCKAIPWVHIDLGPLSTVRIEYGVIPRLNFIAGRPKANPLFWFFGDFRCVCCYLLLFLLFINIKIGKLCSIKGLSFGSKEYQRTKNCRVYRCSGPD